MKKMILSLVVLMQSLSASATLTEGTFAARVPSERIPFRGFWWPQASGRLYKGEDSPLAKYDRFVEAMTGVSPGAQALEERIHPPREVKWAGHDHAYAASAILFKEPKQSAYYAPLDLEFTVSDLKGLLAVISYCPKIEFYGRRAYGEGEDSLDIAPSVFHEVLLKHIGAKGEPIVLDIMANAVVENRVASGYSMKITRDPVRKDVWNVSASVTLHGYDNRPSNETGPAPVFIRNYQYSLFTDVDGNVKPGGRWRSRNPDFAWVPLEHATCKASNTAVTREWVEKILALPASR